jgi:hypothetical protein
MAQNTNSVAYSQLRPLVNNNLGAIVSEHIRYYQNRKDDKDAQQKALDAQASAFNLKRSKAIKDAYEGIAPDENEGFLNSQVLDAWNNKKEYATQLAKNYADGDENAGIELADLTKKFKNLSSLSAVYGTKAQEYASDEGNYNEWLDKPIKNFTKATTTGKYLIDKESLDVMVYDEGAGELRKLKNGELRSNTYLTGAYSGKAKFDENGKAIAANLLDSNQGIKKETAQTRLDGIKLVDAVFGSNDIEARSFLARTRQEDVKDKDGNVIKFNDKDGNPIALGNLNPVQQTKLRSLYYDNYVQPNIVEVTSKATGSGSGTPKDKSKLPTINIVGNTKNGDVRLVADPTLKPTDTDYTGEADTEVYIVDKTVRKEGNTVKTYDKVYYNRNTGQLSVDVSKYQTIITPSGDAVRVDVSDPTKGLITSENAEEKSRKGVATNNVFNDEDITELATALGLQTQDDIIKLLDGSKTSFLSKQKGKKGSDTTNNKGKVR